MPGWLRESRSSLICPRWRFVTGASGELAARIQDKLTGGVAIGTTEDWDRDLFVQSNVAYNDKRPTLRRYKSCLRSTEHSLSL